MTTNIHVEKHRALGKTESSILNKSLVIYGPQGCGKTRASQALARHFGLHTIVDDGSLQPALSPGMFNACRGHLYLTHLLPAWLGRDSRRVLSFDEAMRQAGLEVSA